MENQQLVYTKQHEKLSCSYDVQVYKGFTLRKAHHDFNGTHYSHVVEIKAFRILVREIPPVGSNWKTVEHDFGYCTSRTGEFMYAVRNMEETCKNLHDMKILMAELEEQYRVALDRDAKKAMKKLLGLYNKKTPAYTVTSSSFINRPLPKIQ